MEQNHKTVADGLREQAAEMGVPFTELLEAWAGRFVTIPERYRRIGMEVALALPVGWDDHAEWDVEANPDQDPKGYACVHREEEGDTVDSYTITIYPALMDRLPGAACRWVFAHEFAHIASKLRTGNIVIGDRPYTRIGGDWYEPAPERTVHEDAADKIAMAWGFDPVAFFEAEG